MNKIQIEETKQAAIEAAKKQMICKNCCFMEFVKGGHHFREGYLCKKRRSLENNLIRLDMSLRAPDSWGCTSWDPKE